MSQDTSLQTTVTDNPAESRFEIHVGGELAGFSEYRQRDEQSILIAHTEIGERFGGQGLGGRLAGGMLAQLGEAGLAVVPLCGFVRSYIVKHPGLHGLVPRERWAETGLPG